MFYDDVKNNHIKNSEKASKSEAIALNTIMSQADIVVKNEITFKNIFESGKERRI